MWRTGSTYRTWVKAAICASLIGAAGCVPQFRNYGYIPSETELQEIEVGRDNRQSVAEKVGIPTSAGMLNDSGYYYVRARTRTVGPLAPREIERQVVAISFASSGVVQNVERFGLERGQVVTLSRRVTASSVSNQTFLRQLLGNIGRFQPGVFGG
ncbi:MAG: outer membrane protein assembly factor BamE [Pseudomonadota bacterium]